MPRSFPETQTVVLQAASATEERSIDALVADTTQAVRDAVDVVSAADA
mgnify:CR=1 FL=1